MKNILIIDDHDIVRTGVANLIKKRFPDTFIDHANDIISALQKIEGQNYDLAIIDIKLPNGSTLDLVKETKEKNENCKILMFSGLDEIQYGERFLKLKVNGFLSKNEPVEEILNAINIIFKDDVYMSNELKKKVSKRKFRIDKNPLEQLSSRELEVLSYLLDGYGNLEIAHELDLKNSTVSTYKKRLMEKFDVKNILDLLEKYKMLSNEI